MSPQEHSRLPTFKLRLSTSEIPGLVSRYLSHEGQEDDEALQAGASIAAGDYNRANLVTIFRWKTKGRGISRLSRNDDREIAEALHVAATAQTDRAAVAVLVGLDGVDVPVASAILTAINPQRFTIIDFRSLAVLSVTNSTRTIDFYLAYLGCCRRLAADLGVSLRDLDRALWQWSKEHTRKAEA